MSDSEDTAQLLGSKPSDISNSVILNTNHVKPTSISNSNKSNLFVLNGRKHIFEAFTPAQSYVGASVSALAGLSFGFDMTIGTNLLISLGSILDLNCFEHRMLINGWIAGAIVAAVFGGIIMDKCGRRGTMLGSSLILSISSFLSVTSGAYLIPFIPRFLSGCAVCSLLMSQCVYITETSRTESRSKMIVSQQIALQFGILLSSIVGMQNATNQSNQFFHAITGMVCAFGVFIFFVTYIFLPESPHYIVSRESRTNPTEQHYGNKENPNVNSVFWPLMRTICLVILMQLCGRTWVLYYGPRIFSLTGICFSIADSTAALTTGVIRILSTIILLYTVDRLGIRASILTSLSIMAVSVSFLSVIAAYDQSYSPTLTPGPRVCNVLPVYASIGMLPLAHDTELKFSDFQTIITGDSTRPPFPLLPTPVALHQHLYNSDNPLKCPADELLPPSALSPTFRMGGVIMLLTYEAGFTLGFGSLGWLLVCEIFPTKWRARGLGISIGLYFFIDLMVQMIFLKINLPLYGLFIIFSVTSGLSFIICYLMLLDTRSKSLTQIQTTVNERYGSWLMNITKCVTWQERSVSSQTHI